MQFTPSVSRANRNERYPEPPIGVFMLRKIPEKRRSYSDLLSADEFYAPINAVLSLRLAALGFVRPRQGVWVKEDCLSGRPIFKLRHFKGAVSAPAWGFALTYVPHFNNSCTKLHWHRTVKSARLDVFPFDELEQTQELSRFSTPPDHETAVERVLDAAVRQAKEFFESFQSTEDLLPLFKRLQRDKGSGLGYWNYSNLPVAHAFTLRVNGDYAGGKQILDEYVQRMEISGAALGDLLNRFEQASANSSLL
jgi:hypothetical protein